MTVGEKIKRRRIELGMSQEDLAKKLGYKDRSALSYLEKRGEGLKLSRAKEIAEALRMDPADLLDDYSKPDFMVTDEEASLLLELRSLNLDDYNNVLKYIRFIKESK